MPGFLYTLMKLALVLVLILWSSVAYPQVSDTTDVRDSLKVYRDIERIAKKRPLTFLLYKSIFNLHKWDYRWSLYKIGSEIYL